MIVHVHLNVWRERKERRLQRYMPSTTLTGRYRYFDPHESHLRGHRANAVADGNYTTRKTPRKVCSATEVGQVEAQVGGWGQL